MKKIALLLIVTLICSLFAFPAGAEDDITVLVDGKPVAFDVAPVMKEDRVFIPLRAVGEALGAFVKWDEETQSVTIGRRGVLQHLTLENPTATILSDYEKKEVTLDVAPFTINDRTLVPVRYIAEGFHSQVDWDNNTNTVIIKSHNPVVMTVNGAEITEGLYNFLLVSSEYPENQLLSNFSFNKFVEEAGIAVTDADVQNAINVGSAEEYNTLKKTFLFMGVTESEFDFLARSVASGNLVFDYVSKNATEDEIKAFYQSEFVTAKHILLITEEKDKETVKKQAEELLSRIKKGEDFDKLMKEYSEDPGLADFPDGYTFSHGEMVEQFEKAAYALEVGQVSELVETDYGYHIIKRMPLEPINDINEFRETYAFAFMHSVMDKAEVTKNQELIDSMCVDLRYSVFETIMSQ